MKKVPKASSTPMMKKMRCGIFLISGVMSLVQHCRGYTMIPPTKRYKKLMPWLTKKLYLEPSVMLPLGPSVVEMLL